MKDQRKSKAQLIEELESMRRRVAGLETQESDDASGVSAQNELSAATKRSNALLTSVVESPENIIIFVLDSDYNYLSFNKAHVSEMKRIYDADIEMGRNILTYMPREDDRLKATENYERVLGGGRFVKIEEYG